MGMAKADHIRAVGRAVNAAWRAKHGRDFSEADVQAIFAIFEPMNVAAIADHAALIHGVLDAIAALKARGIRIGSTTGYTRPIMAALAPLAAAQGFVPEATVCAGDLAAGRPAPLQMWHAMAAMVSGRRPVWSRWTTRRPASARAAPPAAGPSAWR